MQVAGSAERIDSISDLPRSHTGETDDAPGAALIGILLMIGAVALGARTAYRATRIPPNRTMHSSGGSGS